MIPPFRKIELLGEGTYGKVFKCKNLTSDEIVAIKKTSLPLSELHVGIPSTTLREMSVLMTLKGLAGIVELKDVILTKDLKHYLVFEYVKTDLRKFIEKNKGSISAPTVRKIIF